MKWHESERLLKSKKEEWYLQSGETTSRVGENPCDCTDDGELSGMNKEIPTLKNVPSGNEQTNWTWAMNIWKSFFSFLNPPWRHSKGIVKLHWELHSSENSCHRERTEMLVRLSGQGKVGAEDSLFAADWIYAASATVKSHRKIVQKIQSKVIVEFICPEFRRY